MKISIHFLPSFLYYFLFTLWFNVLPFRAFPQATPQNDSLKNKLKTARQQNDSAAIFSARYAIAEALMAENRLFEANQHYQKALPYANPVQKLKVYNRQATLLWHKGNYHEAMQMFRKELKKSIEAGSKKYEAIALNNIGFVYAEFDSTQTKTLEYYKKALQIRLQIDDKKGIALSYGNIGLAYLHMDSLKKSFLYHRKALSAFDKIDFPVGKSNALNGMGNLYLKQKNYAKALAYYQQSLTIRDSLGFEYLVAESYKNMTKLYAEKGDFAQAKKNANKGISLAHKLQSKKLLKKFYFELYKIDKAQQNYPLALEHYLLFSQYKDSLFSLESQNKISELEIEYQTEKNAQKIKLLEMKNRYDSELIAKQKSNLVFFSLLSGVLAMLLVVISIVYVQRNFAYKMLVKQNIEIAQLEEKPMPNLSATAENETKNAQKIANEEQIVAGLLEMLEEKKFFLNPACTLDELAKKIGTNRQYLSQIINERFQVSFSHFINKYRISAARKLLLDPQNDKYTIEGIAKLSGFSNRATFTTAFKKETGVTPAFFKKQQKSV